MKKIRIVSLILGCIMLLSCLSACMNEQDIPNEESSSEQTTLEDKPSDTDESQPGITEYKTGDQIEIYLNSATKSIYDFIDPNPNSINIKDTDIVDLQNGKLVPKKQGITYVSCKYGTILKNYNIIVHKGAETVTAWQIDNTNSGTFNGFLGQKYRITTSNSSSCDVSDLKISASTKYKEVEAEDLIRVENDGTIKLIGVGECEVWVRSATNMLDPGVKVKISSSFENQMIGSAVNDWINNNIERSEKNAITNDELNVVKAIRLNQLISFEETDLKSMLPSLNSVVFDLSEECNYQSQYRIGVGDMKYHFVGSLDKTYGFSIITAERENVDVVFENLSLSSIGTDCIDLSNTENASVEFWGKCNFKASDAKTSGDGYNCINAKKLNLTLCKGANVVLIGGNGTNDDLSGTRNGGCGIITVGDLSIESLSNNKNTHLSVFGGNGGTAYYNKTSSGTGGIGIISKQVTFSGYIECTINGGTGGNGKNGQNGNDGPSAYFTDKGTKNAVVHYPTNGTPGEKGGNGGAGGLAHNCKSIIVNDNSDITFVDGSGGRGGDGGRGGEGGNAENGYYGDIHILGVGGVYFFGVTYGGSGGDGGDGGDGGSKAFSDYSIVTGNVKIISGLYGDGGRGGNGGNGKDGGNAGSGSIPKGTLAISEGTTVKGGNGGNGGHGGDGGNGNIPGTAGSGGQKGLGGDGSYLEFDRTWPLSTLRWYGDKGDDGTSGSSGTAGNKVN